MMKAEGDLPTWAAATATARLRVFLFYVRTFGVSFSFVGTLRTRWLLHREVGRVIDHGGGGFVGRPDDVYHEEGEWET